MHSPIVGIGEILWDMLPAGTRPGGAPFNFTAHCRQLGRPTVMVSRVGDDELGHRLRAEVRRLGMSDEFIQVDSSRPTGTVEVTLDSDAVPSYRIIEEVAWDYLAWNEPLQRLAEHARAVCFGTLGQRQATARDTIQRFVSAARATPATKIVCDANFRAPFDDAAIVEDSIRRSRWVKLNADEWMTIRDRLGFSSGEPIREFAARYDLSLVCITLGAGGARVVTPNEDVAVPGVAVRATDTVGAGDAFTAGLLTQLLEERPLVEAVRFANAYAALVATREGGTPVIERAEIDRLC